VWEDREIADRLEDYRVLLVSGFLSQSEWSVIRTFRQAMGMGVHFADQLRWLQEIGVDVRKVQLQTESPPLINAGALAREVKASPKKVLIVSHSKGGLDTLHMLVNWEKARANVAGWIALSTPFHGSPVADYVSRHRPLRKVVSGLLDWVGGSREALVSLTTAECERYLRENDARIAEILGELPFLAVATWKANGKGWDTNLEPFRNWMSGQGIRNDGLVPADSARLTHGDYVVVPDTDHGAPVVTAPQPYDRIGFTRRVLSWLLPSLIN
jgi:hypothetical protein